MSSPPKTDALRELAKREQRRRTAARDPAYLVSFMSAPDERAAEDFTLQHLRDPLKPGEVVLDDVTGRAVQPHYLTMEKAGKDWRWQRFVLDTFHAFTRIILLKARQLGATWLACGYIVWTLLYRPGSLCLIYRQKEEEAWENVTRCHQLLLSLPRWLWNGATVVSPKHNALAKEQLALAFPNGKRSRVVAMTSASASGHGKTAAVILTDEHSRIERAAEIDKAIQPAAGTTGKILTVSTANGVADEETGEGNQFNWKWINAEHTGAHRLFLGWYLHADRDRWWYDNSPEVQELKPHERAEQYPSDEDEAFTLSNQVFFDLDALKHYAKLKAKPVGRFDFERVDAQHARRHEHDRGMVTIYAEPDPDHSYAIGADVASGHGADYSAAYVVDLTNMELVGEFHGRLGEDLYAYQLHYLGRWYNTALIAVETQGGYGNAVIIPLRDGREGRPAYPKLYRHVLSSRPDLPISKPFGWPTNTAARPKIVNGFEKVIRERTLPWVTDGLLKEMQTFVRHDHGPSPAAQQGTRDDRVMAACITLEMYRQHGHHPDRQRRKPGRDKTTLYPWQPERPDKRRKTGHPSQDDYIRTA